MKDLYNLKAGDVILVTNKLLPHVKKQVGCSPVVIVGAFVREDVAYLETEDIKRKSSDKITVKLNDYEQTWFLENPDVWNSRK